jgi:hypothetical protein
LEGGGDGPLRDPTNHLVGLAQSVVTGSPNNTGSLQRVTEVAGAQHGYDPHGPRQYRSGFQTRKVVGRAIH